MNAMIKNYFSTLCGKYLSCVRRDSNEIWLVFTDGTIEKDVISRPLYLYVLCPCRIINTKNRKIFFASSDIYEPKSNIPWSEEFEWDIKGNNLFDEQSKEWLLSNEKIYIKNYKLNVMGDLTLNFSNGDTLEVLTTSTSDDECWSLAERGSNKKHLVMQSNKIIFK